MKKSFTCKVQSISSIFFAVVKCIGARPFLDSDHFSEKLLGNERRRKVITPFGTE
jgi:hypothetical protein